MPKSFFLKSSNIISVMAGLCLSIIYTNYPFPGQNFSISFIVFFIYLIIFGYLIISTQSFPRPCEPLLIIFIPYALFLSYVVYFSIGLENLSTSRSQYLFSLPMIPLISFCIFNLSEFNKDYFLKSFYAIILLGTLLTIIDSINDIRAEGITTNSNTTAIAALLGILILFYYISKQNNKRLILLLSILCIIHIYAIFLTGSRTGLIGFLITFSFLFFNPYISKKIVLSLFVISLVLLPNTIAFERLLSLYDVIGQKVSDYIGVEENYFDKHKLGRKNVINRSESDKTTYELFLENPSTGIGHGKVKKNISVKDQQLRLSHNSYILMLAEYGMVGFFLFLLFIGSIAYVFFTKKYISNSFKFNIIIPFFIILIATSFFFHGFRHKMFWVLLSFATIEFSRSPQCMRGYS